MPSMFVFHNEAEPYFVIFILYVPLMYPVLSSASAAAIDENHPSPDENTDRRSDIDAAVIDGNSYSPDQGIKKWEITTAATIVKATYARYQESSEIIGPLKGILYGCASGASIGLLIPLMGPLVGCLGGGAIGSAIGLLANQKLLHETSKIMEEHLKVD